MDTLYKLYSNRRLIGWISSLGLVLWLSVTPTSAQRRRAKAGADTTLAKAASTSTVRMEEETQFTDGMRYLMTDEPTKAITQFAKVLQKDPNNAAAQYSTATALLKTGKTVEAIPYASKAYSLDNQNKFYALLLAELYVKQKRYSEA